MISKLTSSRVVPALVEQPQSSGPFSASIRMLCRLRQLSLLLALATLVSCERAIDLDLPTGQAQLVVQGHIEPGLPPIVILTNTQPVFAPFDSTTISGSLIHGATVTVTTRDSVFALREVAADSLPTAFVRFFAEQAGIRLAPNGHLPFRLTFYTYLPAPGQPPLLGHPGRTYTLRAQAPDGRALSANTSLPWPRSLDSLWFKPLAGGTPADSLLVLWYRFRDPDTLGNATRYFTKVNAEPFYPPQLQSVFTDEFVNGRTVDFSLERGRPRSAPSVDAARAGLFRRGDTVTVRWCAIDQPHFRFWLSVDNALNSNGSPLAAPAALNSNVRGGLGIWGGYGTTYKTAVAPR